MLDLKLKPRFFKRWIKHCSLYSVACRTGDIFGAFRRARVSGKLAWSAREARAMEEGRKKINRQAYKWAICTMTSFYYYDQNPSGFCCLVQIAAFVIYTSMGSPNLNMKGKAKRILVVVVK